MLKRAATSAALLVLVVLPTGTAMPSLARAASITPLASAPTITQKIMLVVYDPIVESSGSQRLHAVYGWQDPIDLTQGVVSDLETASHGVVDYTIVETQVVDEYPRFDNGFRYTDSTWATAWANRDFPTARFDYNFFLSEFNVVSKVNSGAVDEVWIYGDPLTQAWESTMAGDGAYWINGVPVDNAGPRAFVIMFWNYERGVGEAIHSYGHRTENMMCHIYDIPPGDSCVDPSQGTSWSKFAATELTAPGKGGIGDVHHPVNASDNYDYNNQRYVWSNADAWATYPELPDSPRQINAREWSPSGTDPQREYLGWWYSHIPHFTGTAPDGLLNNWWAYIIQTDQYKNGPPHNPVRKPDGRIRLGNRAFVGNNIYNSTGANQAKTGSKPRGYTVKFGISIQNDGDSADRYTVLATGVASTMFTVTFWRGGTNVTAAVVAGTFTTPALAPGATYLIKVKVKVKSSATVGSSATRLVTITSVGDGSRQDAVMFTGRRF